MSRKRVTDIVAGMSTGTSIILKLTKALEKEGSSPDLLAFLVRPRFGHNLETIARTIAGCDWRFPASEMRRLSEKTWKRALRISRKDRAFPELVNLCWCLACTELGIPIERYSSNPNSGIPAIPPALTGKLDQVMMTYPLIVGYGEKDKSVVVDWGTKSGKVYQVGQNIQGGDIDYVSLANLKYFDLSK